MACIIICAQNAHNPIHLNMYVYMYMQHLPLEVLSIYSVLISLEALSAAIKQVAHKSSCQHSSANCCMNERKHNTYKYIQVYVYMYVNVAMENQFQLLFVAIELNEVLSNRCCGGFKYEITLHLHVHAIIYIYIYIYKYIIFIHTIYVHT